MQYYRRNKQHGLMILSPEGQQQQKRIEAHREIRRGRHNVCQVGHHSMPDGEWRGMCAYCHTRFCSDHEGVIPSQVAGDYLSCPDHVKQVVEMTEEKDRQLSFAHLPSLEQRLADQQEETGRTRGSMTLLRLVQLLEDLTWREMIAIILLFLVLSLPGGWFCYEFQMVPEWLIAGIELSCFVLAFLVVTRKGAAHIKRGVSMEAVKAAAERYAFDLHRVAGKYFVLCDWYLALVAMFDDTEESYRQAVAWMQREKE